MVGPAWEVIRYTDLQLESRPPIIREGKSMRDGGVLTLSRLVPPTGVSQEDR